MENLPTNKIITSNILQTTVFFQTNQSLYYGNSTADKHNNIFLNTYLS